MLLTALGSGDVLVAPGDAYPGVRGVAKRRLAARRRHAAGDERRPRPSGRRCRGRALVWVETPSNPGLAVLDLAGLAAAAHNAGARGRGGHDAGTPLAARGLAAGADVVVRQRLEGLAGHSDLLLGSAAVADPARAASCGAWRTLTGAIPGPFEAWLAHRSLATLGVRLARQEATARALAGLLAARPDVADVRWPRVGSVPELRPGHRADPGPAGAPTSGRACRRPASARAVAS